MVEAWQDDRLPSESRSQTLLPCVVIFVPLILNHDLDGYQLTSAAVPRLVHGPISAPAERAEEMVSHSRESRLDLDPTDTAIAYFSVSG
jgi:hypothetical protein